MMVLVASAQEGSPSRRALKNKHEKKHARPSGGCAAAGVASHGLFGTGANAAVE